MIRWFKAIQDKRCINVFQTHWEIQPDVQPFCQFINHSRVSHCQKSVISSKLGKEFIVVP